VASFGDGLGCWIPTKTLRAMAQFVGRGSLDVIMSVQVDVTNFWKDMVRLILLAVSLSICNLLLIIDVHLFVVVCGEQSVPFIIFSHLMTQMGYADSDISIFSRRDAPFCDCWFGRFSGMSFVVRFAVVGV
jgi:hypothetical protein